MVTLKIDGQVACVPEGTTIMEAAKSVNVKIPHLCYLKDINEISACRVCCRFKPLRACAPKDIILYFCQIGVKVEIWNAHPVD